MTPLDTPPPAEPSSLDHYLAPLHPWLRDDAVTEICINRPGELFIERASGWQREVHPWIQPDWCTALAKLIANATGQRISRHEPLLSATLPSGERVQVVLPPATEEGTVSITIRRPARSLWTLDQLAERGVFETTRLTAESRSATAEPTDPLARHAQGRDWVAFLRNAVRQRKNILLSGATGSGKTTVSKALILEIPEDERVVTIEDVKELVLRRQPNHVRLFYSQGQQGVASVTPVQLLACAKRQRPDRIFVSELRTGDEVHDYLVSINTGHPGSITSVHADSAEMAFVALAQLLKRSDAGRGIGTREGIELARMSIDIVLQCARLRQHRFISEVWYAPHARDAR